MKQELESSIQSAVKSLFDADVEIELTRPEEKFGDFATNIALQLASRLSKNPREIAEQLAEKLRKDLKEQVSEVQVAGAGFINLKLTDEALRNELYKMIEHKGQDYGKSTKYQGQKIVVEYSDPTPFKVLHAGHLYTSIVGDAIANLLEQAGATVHRVNFGGDVGMHVAKCLWGILQELEGEHPEKLSLIAQNERADWM